MGMFGARWGRRGAPARQPPPKSRVKETGKWRQAEKPRALHRHAARAIEEGCLSRPAKEAIDVLDPRARWNRAARQQQQEKLPDLRRTAPDCCSSRARRRANKCRRHQRAVNKQARGRADMTRCARLKRKAQRSAANSWRRRGARGGRRKWMDNRSAHGLEHRRSSRRASEVVGPARQPRRQHLRPRAFESHPASIIVTRQDRQLPRNRPENIRLQGGRPRNHPAR